MSGKRENERIKNKVVGMLTNIVDEVDPKNVLDFLIERRIVNIELKEKMMNKETRRDRCRALLDHLLMCSHDEAFIGFRKALEEHYHWIVERIDNENQDDFNAREEQLEKELNAAKMKLKEANRRTERLDELQNELHSTKTELKDARRELEISKQQIETLKQELEQQVKLKLLASGTQNNIPNEVILENEKIKDQVVSIYKDFVSEVDPTNVFELLIQNGIVGTKERQEMMDNATAKERCRALIDHLFSCSNKNAFIVLKEALNQHYPEIVERLAAFDSDDEEDYSASKLENEKIRNKIFGVYGDFVSNIDPISIFDLLIQNKIVNPKQKQFIMKNTKKEERCRALLDHLTFCSKEKAFIILKEALKEYYPWIAERIEAFDKDNEIEFSTGFESCIIVVGFDNDKEIGQDVIKINVTRTNNESRIADLPPRLNHGSAAAVYDNSLFVTGLGETVDKIWKFDARSSIWEYCNTMTRSRQRHSVAFVDHVLYICGGWASYDKISLDDVEAYDTVDDRCTTVGKLAHAVYNSGNCVPFKSSLYIFGGIDANNKAVDYVQVYDTKLNSCTLLSKRMPVAYRLLRAVLWEHKAILLGCNNCLVYDFHARTWQVRNQFKTGVNHFGMTLHNDRLFVIGGGQNTVDVDGNKTWICRDDARCVSVANVVNGESIDWLHHASLPKPSLIYSLGKMEFRAQ